MKKHNRSPFNIDDDGSVYQMKTQTDIHPRDHLMSLSMACN